MQNKNPIVQRLSRLSDDTVKHHVAWYRDIALNKNCDLLFKSVVVQESSSTCFADEPCKYRFKKYVGVDYTKGRFSLALCFIPGV